MDWTALIHTEMEISYKAADGLLNLVRDDELDWKPATGSNWMTVGQLLVHLVSACGLCMQGFVTGDWTPPVELGYPEDMEGMVPTEQLPSAKNVAWARKYLEKDRLAGLRALETAGEEKLANLALAAPWDPDTERVLGHHCLQMVTHLNVHKAQLFYYLKLMGRDVNTLNLWGI